MTPFPCIQHALAMRQSDRPADEARGAATMTIAEEICHKARQLPEELALEVLDFIGYLEMKHGLTPRRQEEPGRQPTEADNAAENPNEEVWRELLFGP